MKKIVSLLMILCFVFTSLVFTFAMDNTNDYNDLSNESLKSRGTLIDGYVSSKYLKFSSDGESATVTLSNSNSYLNVRNKPSGSIIAKLKHGKVVKVHSDGTSGGWTHILFRD